MSAPVADALNREAQAVQTLLSGLKDLIGDDEAFAADVIEGQTDFVEVVNALVLDHGADKAAVAGLKSFIDTLKARKERLEYRIERRRELLLRAFQTAGIKGPLRCAAGSVGTSNTPPKAIETDAMKIPDEFWKTPEPELNRKALLAALNEGRKIPGAELSNGGVSLSIRTA
jgi:hypothetical protein